MIAVNVNDHDRLILNSYKKSFSKKGNSLRECWRVYQSDCGSDDPAKQSAIIPAFVFGDLVYEFVCESNVIAKLEEHPSSLHSIEIEKQTVLALKDTNVLVSLMVDDGRTAPRSAEYLCYRVSDLSPIRQLMAESSD